MPDANAWWYVLAFAFQIYGDFSGYTDIARGLAKIMGFELVENFRAPYSSRGRRNSGRIGISASPPGCGIISIFRSGEIATADFKTYRNLMITMVLGGLWHGAGFCYLLWGFYHGTLLCLQRAWNELTGHGPHRPHPPLRELVGRWPIVGFFVLTCVGWLIFRLGSSAPGLQPGLLCGISSRRW